MPVASTVSYGEPIKGWFPALCVCARFGWGLWLLLFFLGSLLEAAMRDWFVLLILFLSLLIILISQQRSPLSMWSHTWEQQQPLLHWGEQSECMQMNSFAVGEFWKKGKEKNSIFPVYTEVCSQKNNISHSLSLRWATVSTEEEEMVLHPSCPSLRLLETLYCLLENPCSWILSCQCS